MPQLVADALELYLAEIAAQSIIRQVDITGAVSASAHDRHKFPRSEINNFLNLAAATPKHSFQRLVAVVQLMNIAGGAYANLKEMCASDALGNVDVQSHYSTKARHLRIACLDEPMNLFYGSASGNVSGGAALDLHQLEVADLGNVQLRSNIFDYLAPDGADPQGPRKMEQVAPNLRGRLQGDISVNGGQPPLTRSPSAYSLNLQGIHQNRGSANTFVQGAIANVFRNETLSLSKMLCDDLKKLAQPGSVDTHGQAFWRDKQRIMTALDTLITEFTTMTAAGKKHYVDLGEDIKARNGLNSDILKQALITITKAYHGWNTNRKTILDRLTKIRGNLNHPGTTDLLLFDPFGNSSVNKLSFLLGVSNDCWWQ